MKNKKKLVALLLVLVMAITSVAGATLAYFTDDEQATNTMVIGNVEINIEEWTYLPDEDGNKVWAPFADDTFTLYPIENVKGNEINNKIVHTFNTSASQDDAYIRTIVLFEKNDLLTENYVGEADCCMPGLHFSYHNVVDGMLSADGHYYYGSTAEVLDEVVTINGNEYYVVVFTAASEAAIPYNAALYTLSGVWMDKNITSEQIDGWDGGEENKVEILVLSQGIQETGLTHAEAMEALGTVDQTNLTAWFDGDDAVINNWVDKN